MKYREYNDYELLSYINEDNEEANNILYEKYRPLIESTSKKIIKYCSNTGLDINDLIQEGMIGLSQAISTFKDTKETSFYTYAKTCIDRKIISIVISSRRLKHKILNESISLETTDDFGNEIYSLFLEDKNSNPLQILEVNESENELIDKTYKLLTDFEKEVFDLKKSGFTYKEIASILDKSPKAIDNALQRIRTKIISVKSNIN